MRKAVPLVLGAGVLILAAFIALPEKTSRARLLLPPKTVGKTGALFTFSDSTFAEADWAHETIVDVHAGTSSPTATYLQDSSWGLPAPSRKTERHFTCDPALYTRFADASWATNSSFDPDTLTVHFVSFRFDHYTAGVTLYPLIVQDDKFYLGPYVQKNYPYSWEAYYSPALIPDDFSVYASPLEHPDFTQPMMFGYVLHTSSPSGQSNCPRDIPTTVWVDNFNVSIDQSLPSESNHPPHAVDDLLIARSVWVQENEEVGHWYAADSVNVLFNDFDPDGDALAVEKAWVVSGGNGASAGVASTPGYAWFYWGAPTSRIASFDYLVSDGELKATGNVLVLIDCACVIACYLETGKRSPVVVQETIDLGFIRRFRDEVMEKTEHGSQLVDLYYSRMPEMLWLMIISHPELGAQAVEMVELIQPVLRNLLDGDGTMTFTQEQMDAVEQFASDLSAVASDSLAARISDELDRVGPLGAYVGMPVSIALATVLGNPIDTAVESRPDRELPNGFRLEQNYPNPFNPETTIAFEIPVASAVRLVVYDVTGREMAVLLDKPVQPGHYDVRYDARLLPSGTYIYRLSTPDGSVSKAMQLVK